MGGFFYSLCEIGLLAAMAGTGNAMYGCVGISGAFDSEAKKRKLPGSNGGFI